MDFTVWHGSGMWIFWIAVAIAVGIFILWLNRRGERRGSWMTPRERLEDRFGRGEIGAQEYEAGLLEIERGEGDELGGEEEGPGRSGDRGSGAGAILVLLCLTGTSSAATEPPLNRDPSPTPTTAWEDPLYPSSQEGAALVALPNRGRTDLGDALERGLQFHRESVSDPLHERTLPSPVVPLPPRLSTVLEMLRSRSDDPSVRSLATETGPRRLFTCAALGRGRDPG